MQLQDKNKKKKISSSRFVAVTGIFGAAAIVLSALENMLPALPMMPPGAKLGLSNVVTMYTSEAFGFAPAFLIAIIKGVFTGLMRGPTSMIMSISGGVASTVVMWALFKIKKMGYIGVGVLGALTHNAAQLLIAYFITSQSVIWYVPWLIIFSIITGSLTGLLMKTVMPLLMKLQKE